MGSHAEAYPLFVGGGNGGGGNGGGGNGGGGNGNGGGGNGAAATAAAVVWYKTKLAADRCREGKKSVTRRYEFYEYKGTVTDEGEADPQLDIDVDASGNPLPTAIGALKGHKWSP